MAKKELRIGIGFDVDKTSLNSIKQSLKELSNVGITDLQIIKKRSVQDAQNDLKDLKKSILDVQNALTQSYSIKFDTVDVKTFNQEIDKTQGGLKNLASTMNSAGTQGKAAFTDLISTIFTAKDAAEETNKAFDSLKTTFLNTVKWSISSGLLNMFSGSIQKAWNFAQDLDSSLNNIRIVTEKSSKEMEKFADKANRAAKALGSTTLSYTNAALIYYQQGLSDKEVQARTDVTIKAANVTGQSAAEVSEQLTAVWNGYKVVASEAELYIDKLAAVAASTAADLEELSTGMSKVASAANAMGIDVDQLAAQLSTIISVTRQDASVVGTALKTIYSRMGDLQADGVDEFGVSLGQVSSQLELMGVNVLDQEGNLRDMGTVIEEVAAKWGTWTEAQQQAAAVAIAGKRQYNNLIALFENWDMYESSMSTSQNAAGTLEKQNEIYLDSIEAKLKKLKTETEGLFKNIIDTESTKGLIDVLTWLVNAIDNLAQGLGGLGGILTTVAGILTKIYSSDFAKSMGSVAQRYMANKLNADQEYAQNYAVQQLEKVGLKPKQGEDLTDAQKEIVRLAKDKLKYNDMLTDQQKEQYNQLILMTAELEKQKNSAEDIVQKITGEVKSLAPVDARFKGADSSQLSVNDIQGTRDFIDNQVISSRNTKGIIAAAGKRNASRETRAAALTSIKKTELSEQNVIRMKEAQEKYKTTLAAVRKEESLNSQQLQEFYSYLKEADEILNDNIEELEEYSDTLQKNSEKLRENASTQKQVNKEAKNLDKSNHIREISKQIAELTSTLMLSVSMWQSILNIFNIFRDETLTTGEKITQAITAILSIIAMSTPIIISAIKLLSATTRAEMTKIQISMGIVGIILAAISIALGVVMALINKPSKPTALEQAKKAAEEAAEAAEEARQKVESLKQEYENLITAVTDYQAAVEALEKLTEGTEEWGQAVEGINEKVLDLINTYPELAKGFTITNGVFSISDSVLKEFQESQKQAQYLALFSSYQANITAAKSQKKLNTAALKENIMGQTSFDGRSIYLDQDGDGVKKRVSLISLAMDGLDETDLNLLRKEFEESSDSTLTDAFSSFKEIEEAANTIDGLIEENNRLQTTQNEIIKVNTQAIIAAIGNEYGFGAEIFTSFAKDESGNDRTASGVSFDTFTTGTENVSAGKNKNTNANRFKYSSDESLANLQRVFARHTGKVAEKGSRDKTAAAIHAALVNALPGHEIIGPTGSDLSGDNKKLENLGKVEIYVDGQKMEITSALKLAEKDALKTSIFEDADIQTLQKVTKAGYNENAAWFVGTGATGEDWKGATLAALGDLAKVPKDDDVLGTDYSTNIETAKARLKNTFSTLGFNEEEISKMDFFTEEDAKNLNSVKDLAVTAGKDVILNTVFDSIQNPEVYKQAAEAAADVDWTDANSIADFYFSYMGDIQEKIRKKELDYFKNINKELDKLNRDLEKAIGGQKQYLLNQKIAQEEAGRVVAESQVNRANSIFDNYIKAYGYEEFLNSSGELNIAAVNNRIAQLDPEKSQAEQKEYDRLIALQDHWDYVIESEEQLLDYSDRIIDAQIEAFKYQYEYVQELLDFTKKLSNFKREFDDFNDGFNSFAEKSFVQKYESLVKEYDFNSKVAALYLNKFNEEYADTLAISDILQNIATAKDEKATLEEELAVEKENYNKAKQKATNSGGNPNPIYNPYANNAILGNNSTSRWGTPTSTAQAAANNNVRTAEANVKSKEAEIAAKQEYINQQEAILATYTSPYYDAKNGTFKADAFKADFGGDLEGAFEVIRDMKQNIADMYELYKDGQQEILKLYNEEIDKLNTINGLLEGSATLSKMFGLSSTNYYSQITTNAKTAYDLTVASLTPLKGEWEKLGADATQEMKEAVANAMAEAGNNAIEAAQSWMDAIANEFEAKLTDAINTALGEDLVKASENWELALEKENQTLDAVNSEYAVDTLERKYQKAIDATDSVTAQNKLNKAMKEQMTMLREKDKLTQYEVDRANAMYELTLKQIALEEAQQASNKMKLVRDAYGNFTYQYVADQDAIAQAEEELAAAENNLYNLDKQRNESLVSEYYSTMTEANQQIAAAIKEGDTERAEALKEHYFGANGILSGIKTELALVTENYQAIGEMVTGNEDWVSQYSDISNKLLNSDLNTLANSINTLLYGSTGNNGTISAISEIATAVTSLLGADGISAVVSAVNATKKDTIDLALDVGEIQRTTTAILTAVPPLVEALGGAEGLAKELEGYADKYIEWLKINADSLTVVDQVTALTGNTTALTELKGSVDILNGTLAYADGTLKFGTNGDANGEVTIDAN